MDLFKQFPSSSLTFDEEFLSFFQLAEDKAISTLDLVSLSNLELAKLSGRSSVITKKVQNILEKEVAKTIEIRNIDLSSLDDELYKYFTTGDEQIDELLDGGISLGRLTEIVGASATGKSHLLLQLAITVQLPREFGGLGFQLSDDVISNTQTASMNKYQLAKVIYISTESGIETRRLSLICKNFETLMQTNGINKRYWPTIDNVYQVTCNDLETQDHILFYQVPNLVRSQPIKLIIVDSIAHHLRIEFQTKDPQILKKTWSYIYKFTGFLKKLAHDHQLAVVMSNQVSDRPMSKIHGSEPSLSYDYQLGWLSGWDNETILKRQWYDELTEYDDNSNRSFDQSGALTVTNFNSKQIPALGMIWQNRVDHRVILSKYEQPIWDELLKTIRVSEDDEQGEEDDQDISKNFEVKRRIWYNDNFMNFQIWKGGIRRE